MQTNRFHLAFFFLCVATALHTWAGQSDGTVDMYWNDVEGGGATLIVTPQGESVLIDSGNPGGRDAGRIFGELTKLLSAVERS
jgi:hypothetical protein